MSLIIARKGSVWKRFEAVWMPGIFLIASLSIWEMVVRILQVPMWLLPAPSQIANRLIVTDDLWHHARITWTEALAGFAISAVLGILIAAAIATWALLEKGLFPYMVVANSIPVVAIVPLLTIWLGFGMAPKIAIAAIMTFFPIVTNTTRGLKSADPRILELMKSINATRWQTFRKVMLPGAVPYVFAAFKIAIPLALIGAVVGEFYGASQGLGYLVVRGAYQLMTDLLFVCIFLLAASGVSLFFLFSWLEGRFAKWEA